MKDAVSELTIYPGQNMLPIIAININLADTWAFMNGYVSMSWYQWFYFITNI